MRPARPAVRTFALALALGLACAPAARAAPPAVPLANQQVTLDGTPLGSAIAGRSAYPTILSIGGVYHMWVQVQDGAAANLRIASYRHATSTDGLAFTTQGPLTFAGDPFAATLYGSTFGEPPWIYPRASGAGPVTFQFWTYNTPPDVTGDYNYNLSINTIAAPGTHALTHYGPVGEVPLNGIAGQTAGGFGIVGNAMYYDYNSSLGRATLSLAGPGPFPAGAGGPWYATTSNAVAYPILSPLGFSPCHLGGDTYVHNSARVVDNGDGTLGFFFTLRNCDGTRKDSQVYYAESADDGGIWGAPVGLFSGPATIGGAALQPGYSLADVVVRNGQRIVYFNAFDTQGNLVVGALPPVPPRPSVPVPVNAPAALALLALLLALAASGARRARAGRSDPAKPR